MDFSSPFENGLRAAATAAKNREEVAHVFAQFNASLEKLSNGTAEVFIGDDSLSLNALARAVGSLTNTPSQLAIMVRNPKSPSFLPRKIAGWKQGEQGYPCTIASDSRVASCDGLESLVRELSNLFGSAKAGEAISAAMSHASTPAGVVPHAGPSP